MLVLFHFAAGNAKSTAVLGNKSLNFVKVINFVCIFICLDCIFTCHWFYVTMTFWENFWLKTVFVFGLCCERFMRIISQQCQRFFFMFLRTFFFFFLKSSFNDILAQFLHLLISWIGNGKILFFLQIILNDLFSYRLAWFFWGGDDKRSGFFT